MRILCVDYGRSRVGLAVSDALGRTAQPLEVIQRPKRGSLIDPVVEVARRVEAEQIVVGLPLKLDGSPGVAAESARSFAQSLRERAGLPVVLWDERLSTVEASRRMRTAGTSGSRRRKAVDKVAAAVILQSYLQASGGRDVDPEDTVLPEAVPPREYHPPEHRRPRDRRPRRKRDDWRRDLGES